MKNSFSQYLFSICSARSWVSAGKPYVRTLTGSLSNRGEVHITINSVPGLMKTDYMAKEHLSHLLAHFL